MVLIELQNRLDPDRFFANRYNIVNLSYLKGLSYRYNGKYIVASAW
ncbi:hypothetical protein [Persicitalea jodogahamensis]|uniref:Uncharacterized protein n=1 Tax=Persicitalea jodogahamensis TaxID=402147 RepID=A0A8J3D822_9BACT|nr:hypothetical protein [Persicitalea jodogahamensis]GHB86680.1 hypothetical protein GCM10007390_47920 [Persicitalea jodogahamensis]